MPEEDYSQEIENIKEQIDSETPDQLSLTNKDYIAESCPICKHAARDLITEIYYDNGNNVESVKIWFFNKFKRKYADDKWESHFKNHVEPFVKSYVVLKNKKLNELMERATDFKKSSPVSQSTIIKQMLVELMVDGFVNKPDNMMTKEDRVNFHQFSKTIATLAKTYHAYEQMERDALGLGKTEEEQKEIMKQYLNRLVNNIFKVVRDMPEAQERISEALGIPIPQQEKGDEINIEDVSI